MLKTPLLCAAETASERASERESARAKERENNLTFWLAARAHQHQYKRKRSPFAAVAAELALLRARLSLSRSLSLPLLLSTHTHSLKLLLFALISVVLKSRWQQRSLLIWLPLLLRCDLPQPLHPGPLSASVCVCISCWRTQVLRNMTTMQFCGSARVCSSSFRSAAVSDAAAAASAAAATASSA